jgi:hypothetical protein
MRLAVPTVSDGRGHINLPFDQLGLLEIGHRVVAAFELGAGEAVAVLQRGDRGRGLGRAGGLGSMGQTGHRIGSRSAGISSLST